MVKRDDVVRHLAEVLRVDEFEDYCVNGLQVEGTEEINRIVCGVSASARLFEEARQREAEAVLVHHGLFWKNDPWMAVTGFRRHRLDLLLGNNINLLGYHLPLDAHPSLGNNAQIAERLGLKVKEQVFVGCVAATPAVQSRDEFLTNLKDRLGEPLLVFPFGREAVQTVGILSGGGASYYGEALKAGCDTFLSGEIKEHIVREAEEAGLNYVVLGHYNSETWGPRALAEYLPTVFDVEAEFVDVPNPA